MGGLFPSTAAAGVGIVVADSAVVTVAMLVDDSFYMPLSVCDSIRAATHVVCCCYCCYSCCCWC